MYAGGRSHPRAIRTLVLAAIAGALLAGCNETSDPVRDRPTKVSPSNPATPTSSPEREADTETKALAEAGVLRTEDFGAGWEEYSEGRLTTRDEREAGCAHRVGALPDDLGAGALQTGPTVQVQGANAYSTSFTFVLPTVERALELIDGVSGRDWIECKRAELLEYQRNQGFDETEVVVDPDEDPSLGKKGLESETTFLYADDGAVTGAAELAFYRLDRVVILVQNDIGPAEEAQLDTFDDGLFRALSRAYDRVNAAL